MFVKPSQPAKEVFDYLNDYKHVSLGFFFPESKSVKEEVPKIKRIFRPLSQHKKNAILSIYSKKDIVWIIQDILNGHSLVVVHIYGISGQVM